MFLPRLRALQRARTLVRIQRDSIDDGHITGRIVGCSAKLLAIASLDEGVRPDGYQVLRRADISNLEAPDPHADFVATALRLRRAALRGLPRVDLTSWRSVVAGVSRRFPLVTVHAAVKAPDVCYIGAPAQLTARTVTLVTIDPDARWDRDAVVTLAWADITEVDFGGAYEEALALVASRARNVLNTRPQRDRA